MSMNAVMVSRVLPLLIILLLLPSCSSSLLYTDGIHFPIIAFLTSSRQRQQRHQQFGVGSDDVASKFFGRTSTISLFDNAQHQYHQSLLSLHCVGGARQWLQGTPFKSINGIISSSNSNRGNNSNNIEKWIYGMESSSSIAKSSLRHAEIKTKTRIDTTLYSSSSSSDSFNDDECDDRFHNVNVAGVSVSPQGFLVLLQSDFDSSGNCFVDDDNATTDATTDDVGDEDTSTTLTLAFPILLTVPPLDDNDDDDALSSSAAYTNDNDINNNETATITTYNDDNKNKNAPQLPELFQLNKNMDQTSVSSPEALTYLQLLNGVDMATPVLPPDILSLVCVWYAFLLLEEEENEESSGIDDDDDDAGETELNNDSLVMVEDELGLNDSSNSNNDIDNNATTKCANEFRDALDYIRAMVRTTLPPDKNLFLGGSDSGVGATNFLAASPGQRSKVQLPRVWLRGVRLQEAVMEIEKDDSKSITRTTTSDTLKATIGRLPIQFTLQCSVDDGSKRLDVPLFAIPTMNSVGWKTLTTQPSEHHQVQTMLREISHELLQELSHNYNVETSASFLSLALFQRYSNKSSGGRGGYLNSGSVPTLQVSNGLLKKLMVMQQCQDNMRTRSDDSIGQRARYCWVLPTLDDGTEKNNDINNNIDKIIKSQGVPLFRSLNQIQEEGQRGMLKRGNGSSAMGGDNTSKTDASDSNLRRRKSKPLTMEQQATKQRLMSAWKVATQRNDAGALERIQKAMEDLENEVMYEDGGNDDEEKTSTLNIIQRAMQDDSGRVQIPLGDGGINTSPPQDSDIVGLISELEEATMNSSMSENAETGNDER